MAALQGGVMFRNPQINRYVADVEASLRFYRSTRKRERVLQRFKLASTRSAF